MSDITQSESIRYAVMPSPIGELLIASTRSGIVYVAFENHDFDQALHDLETQFGLPCVRDDAALEFATDQLGEYFAGTRKYFELPVYQESPERFVTQIQQHLAAIPYGETRSYGELAQQLDKPRAARAVGSACARNPVPLIQPCHRVVRADGSYGHFSGTPKVKAYLLALEAGEKPHAPAS